MTKYLVKIISICAFVVLIPVIIAGVALCAVGTTAYKLSVYVVGANNENAQYSISIGPKDGEKKAATTATFQKGTKVNVEIAMEGYDFQGWYEGEPKTYSTHEVLSTVVNDGVAPYEFEINGNTNLTAVVKTKVYTIAFTGKYANGEELALEAIENVKYGDALPTDITSKVEGITFVGWQLVGGNGEIITHAKFDKSNQTYTLQPVWSNSLIVKYVTDKGVDMTVEYYTQQQFADLANSTMYIGTNERIENLFKTPEYLGREFAGWTIKNPQGEEVAEIEFEANKTYTLILKQVIIPYTLTITGPKGYAQLKYDVDNGFKPAVGAGTVKDTLNSLERPYYTANGVKFGELIYYYDETDNEFYDNLETKINRLSSAIVDTNINTEGTTPTAEAVWVCDEKYAQLNITFTAHDNTENKANLYVYSYDADGKNGKFTEFDEGIENHVFNVNDLTGIKLEDSIFETFTKLIGNFELMVLKMYEENEVVKEEYLPATLKKIELFASTPQPSITNGVSAATFADMLDNITNNLFNYKNDTINVQFVYQPIADADLTKIEYYETKEATNHFLKVGYSEEQAVEGKITPFDKKDRWVATKLGKGYSLAWANKDTDAAVEQVTFASGSTVKLYINKTAIEYTISVKKYADSNDKANLVYDVENGFVLSTELQNLRPYYDVTGLVIGGKTYTKQENDGKIDFVYTDEEYTEKLSDVLINQEETSFDAVAVWTCQYQTFKMNLAVIHLVENPIGSGHYVGENVFNFDGNNYEVFEYADEPVHVNNVDGISLEDTVLSVLDAKTYTILKVVESKNVYRLGKIKALHVYYNYGHYKEITENINSLTFAQLYDVVLQENPLYNFATATITINAICEEVPSTKIVYAINDDNLIFAEYHTQESLADFVMLDGTNQKVLDAMGPGYKLVGWAKELNGAEVYTQDEIRTGFIENDSYTLYLKKQAIEYAIEGSSLKYTVDVNAEEFLATLNSTYTRKYYTVTGLKFNGNVYSYANKSDTKDFYNGDQKLSEVVGNDETEEAQLQVVWTYNYTNPLKIKVNAHDTNGYAVYNSTVIDPDTEIDDFTQQLTVNDGEGNIALENKIENVFQLNTVYVIDDSQVKAAKLQKVYVYYNNGNRVAINDVEMSEINLTNVFDAILAKNNLYNFNTNTVEIELVYVAA